MFENITDSHEHVLALSCVFTFIDPVDGSQGDSGLEKASPFKLRKRFNSQISYTGCLLLCLEWNDRNILKKYYHTFFLMLFFLENILEFRDLLEFRTGSSDLKANQSCYIPGIADNCICKISENQKLVLSKKILMYVF